MTFKRMPKVFPEQDIWGASAGPFSFVITNDGQGYSASAREQTAPSNTHHLGGGYCAYTSFHAAQNACRQFWRERRN